MYELDTPDVLAAAFAVIPAHHRGGGARFSWDEDECLRRLGGVATRLELPPIGGWAACRVGITARARLTVAYMFPSDARGPVQDYLAASSSRTAALAALDATLLAMVPPRRVGSQRDRDRSLP
jgi:hypothetical protein